MALDPPQQELPPLHALRVLEAAARLESFSRAGEELFVTSGAVAQQVKRLEKWAGQPFFDRHAHGVRLNEAGRYALPVLTQAVDALGAAAAALRPRGGERTSLRIVALPAIAQLWLTPRLSDLRRRMPGLAISVAAVESIPSQRLDPFDLGLFFDAPSPATGVLPDLYQASSKLTLLGRDELVPVCAPSLVVAGLNAPLDLAQFELLHDTTWSTDWADWLDGCGATVDILDSGSGTQFSLYSMAVQAAVDGGGVLVGRRSLVAAHLRTGALVEPFASDPYAHDHVWSDALVATFGTSIVGESRMGSEAVDQLIDWLQAS